MKNRRLDGKKENREKASRLRFFENSEKVQKKVGTPELRSVRKNSLYKIHEGTREVAKEKEEEAERQEIQAKRWRKPYLYVSHCVDSTYAWGEYAYVLTSREVASEWFYLFWNRQILSFLFQKKLGGF